ncbi:MAG: hypothetical protein M2R45_03075 [Verrucomicrobia subdivision 3 bacterium]|nr:hypothetical protein [Limisphaerales bacterium]MCS1416561.1 hypothetical protein [Limisphaerales bacterium]
MVAPERGHIELDEAEVTAIRELEEESDLKITLVGKRPPTSRPRDRVPSSDRGEHHEVAEILRVSRGWGTTECRPFFTPPGVAGQTVRKIGNGGLA